MKWKAWGLPFVVFVGICLLADWIFTSRIILGSPLSDASRIKRLYSDNSDEIPIFGTSKAHGHYSPSDMGLPAFNYGMDAASFEATDVLLQIELAKSRAIPVIIELQHGDTGTLGFTGKYIPFVSDPKFRQLLRHFHAMSWRYYFPGIRYFGFYDSFLDIYLNERMHVQKVNQGYSELVHPPAFDQAQLDIFVRDRKSMKTGYFQDEDQARRFVAHISGHPQRLFFLIVSPYHPAYYEHFQNAEQFAAFEKQLASLPNVVLLDWGRLYDSDKFFLDTLHLRREAAADFSHKLGEQIKQVLRERAGQSLAENKPRQ